LYIIQSYSNKSYCKTFHCSWIP